ncbi:MAG TPA: hypothetical protein VKF79_10420, partial [Candidatus Acidoferrum sp.]|nr:hypothetical protein [Candidatus Acidoferrum sp.]
MFRPNSKLIIVCDVPKIANSIPNLSCEFSLRFIDFSACSPGAFLTLQKSYLFPRSKLSRSPALVNWMSERSAQLHFFCKRFDRRDCAAHALLL